MNTDHLSYVLSVAQCASINKAAQKLGLQHPYLSRIVASVEKEIGVPIFKRTNKGVEPTAEGEEILKRIAIIAEQTQGLCRDFSPPEVRIYPEYQQTVCIYSIAQIKQPKFFDFMPALQTQFPNLHIQTEELPPLQILQKLLDMPLTLAILPLAADGTLNGTSLPPELQTIPLAKASLTALASPENQLAQKHKAFSLARLMKETLIFYSPHGLEETFLYQFLLSRGHQPQVKYVVSNLNLFHQLLGSCSEYYSISITKGTDRYNLVDIPLKDNITFSVALVGRQECLDFLPIKTLINMELVAVDSPLRP